MINSMKRKSNQRNRVNIYSPIKKLTEHDSDFNKRSPSKPKLSRRSHSKEELDLMYMRKVTQVKEKYAKLIKKNPNKLFAPNEIYKEIKRCEACCDFINQEVMMFCTYCGDAYHTYCDGPANSKPRENFECYNCQDKLEKDQPVPTKLRMEMTKKKIQKKCNQCNDKIEEVRRSHSAGRTSEKGDKVNYQVKIIDEEGKGLKTCFKCQKDFHLKCFRADWNSTGTPGKLLPTKKCRIICDKCENSIQSKMKITKISDYFKPQKAKNVLPIKISDQSIKNKSNDGKLKLPKELSPQQKETLQKSLFRALQVKGIEFEDDLVFCHENCPPESNNSSLEIGIQQISDYNKKIYYQFKERTRKADYAPLEIVDDELQVLIILLFFKGFTVRATDDIPALTLICEYTGDVALAREKVFTKNDSVMELLITPSSATSLVICPEKKSNIARFISGINNFDKNSLKKQNVRTSRFDIDGHMHILLYASKLIKRNETLYYDYNAGGQKSYDTSYFV